MAPSSSIAAEPGHSLPDASGSLAGVPRGEPLSASSASPRSSVVVASLEVGTAIIHEDTLALVVQ